MSSEQTLVGQVTNLVDQALSQTSRPLLNIPQRLPDEVEITRRNQDNLSREIRVAIPCKVVSFDPSKQTIVAQPLIREKRIDRETGDVFWQALPVLLDVPVQFPQAGGFVLTMPVSPGDEVLVIFQDTCIDAWWEAGGVQNWMDRRRHDLSDGIAIPGINSVPNVIQNIASNGPELRSKDGRLTVGLYRTQPVPDVEAFVDTIQIANGPNASISMVRDWGYVEVNGVKVEAETSNAVDITAGTINLNGTVKHNGNDYTHHVHAGVTTGPSVSGPVVEEL